jgi:hypothetical protein
VIDKLKVSREARQVRKESAGRLMALPTMPSLPGAGHPAGG